MNIFFTVCNRISLPHTLVLAESLQRFHHEAQLMIGWVDTAEPAKLPSNCQLIPVTEAGLTSWKEMEQEYLDFELVAACRPWFAKHIFVANPSCNRLIFLAPTTLLFAPVTEVITTDADIILTPNIVKPLPRNSELLDRRVLNIGMFNSNAWIMRKSGPTLDFLEWWCTRTIDRAKFNLCEGMCMDQLWLNFAPVRTPELAKAKSPGWHFGLHSAANYRLEHQNGVLVSEGTPILSMDFAGLLVFDPIWSDYTSLISGNTVFKTLLNDYRKSVAQTETQYGAKGIPGYGKASDISSMRTVRNKWAARLTKITHFIDHLEI